jgi:hypothetical protein
MVASRGNFVEVVGTTFNGMIGIELYVWQQPLFVFLKEPDVRDHIGPSESEGITVSSSEHQVNNC